MLETLMQPDVLIGGTAGVGTLIFLVKWAITRIDRLSSILDKKLDVVVRELINANHHHHAVETQLNRINGNVGRALENIAAIKAQTKQS